MKTFGEEFEIRQPFRPVLKDAILASLGVREANRKFLGPSELRDVKMSEDDTVEQVVSSPAPVDIQTIYTVASVLRERYLRAKFEQAQQQEEIEKQDTSISEVEKEAARKRAKLAETTIYDYVYGQVRSTRLKNARLAYSDSGVSRQKKSSKEMAEINDTLRLLRFQDIVMMYAELKTSDPPSSFSENFVRAVCMHTESLESVFAIGAYFEKDLPPIYLLSLLKRNINDQDLLHYLLNEYRLYGNWYRGGGANESSVSNGTEAPTAAVDGDDNSSAVVESEDVPVIESGATPTPVTLSVPAFGTSSPVKAQPAITLKSFLTNSEFWDNTAPAVVHFRFAMMFDLFEDLKDPFKSNYLYFPYEWIERIAGCEPFLHDQDAMQLLINSCSNVSGHMDLNKSKPIRQKLMELIRTFDVRNHRLSNIRIPVTSS